MTPLKIGILLHYHCSATDYPDLSPPAQQNAIDYFLDAGFLIKTDLSDDMPAGAINYQPTEKLHVYCEALCRVQEPEQVWRVPGVVGKQAMSEGK